MRVFHPVQKRRRTNPVQQKSLEDAKKEEIKEPIGISVS